MGGIDTVDWFAHSGCHVTVLTITTLVNPLRKAILSIPKSALQ